MIKIPMQITIKSLYKKSYNKSEISRLTGHDRKTVRKIITTLESGKYLEKNLTQKF